MRLCPRASAGGGTSRGLPPATANFEKPQVSHDAALVLSPTPDLPVGTPVSAGVILSRQAVTFLRQAQHGGAVMHMHRLHGIGQRLILVLVGQTDALRVRHLDFGSATSRDRCKGREIDGNLRPGLENLEQHIVTLDVAVERRDQEPAPASGEVRHSGQSQFVHEAVAPEMLVKQSVERPVKGQAGRRIQPPRD